MGRLLFLFALLLAGSAFDNGLAWTLIISVICMMLMLEAMQMNRATAKTHSEPE
jgi:CDP-diglyceride synthetase